jgi:hypothetical protein
MRTTVDLPDDLFRRTKALAALRGDSFKNLVVHAIETEVAGRKPAAPGQAARRTRLPLIRLHTVRKLDLTGFDFDDLLT